MEQRVQTETRGRPRNEKAWVEKCNRVVKFIDANGRRPSPKGEDGEEFAALAIWLANQVREYHKGKLGDARAAQLEVIPDWKWENNGKVPKTRAKAKRARAAAKKPTSNSSRRKAVAKDKKSAAKVAKVARVAYAAPITSVTPRRFGPVLSVSGTGVAEPSKNSSTTPYSSSSTSVNSMNPLRAELVSKRALSDEEKESLATEMRLGHGTLKKGTGARQKDASRAHRHICEELGRDTEACDTFPRSRAAQRQQNGKQGTGSDNFGKQDNLSHLYKFGNKFFAVMSFGEREMVILSPEQAFLYLPVPQVELTFRAPRPSTVGLPRKTSEAGFANLLEHMEIVSMLNGLQGPYQDLTTGQLAKVDLSKTATFAVAGRRLPVGGAQTEIDRVQYFHDQLTALSCEYKLGLSDLMPKRQIFYPALHLYSCPDAPAFVQSAFIQGVGKYLKNEGPDGLEIGENIEFADEVYFHIYNILVPTDDMDDMSVATSYRVKVVFDRPYSVGTPELTEGVATRLQNVALGIDLELATR